MLAQSTGSGFVPRRILQRLVGERVAPALARAPGPADRRLLLLLPCWLRLLPLYVTNIIRQFFVHPNGFH